QDTVARREITAVVPVLPDVIWKPVSTRPALGAILDELDAFPVQFLVTADILCSNQLRLCAAKADNVNLTFGIAAFDIDYDDYDNTCVSLNTYGRHSRLQRLKMVVDYFRSNTGVAYREDACRMFGA
ncbi:hypothetical protein MTO96_038831, partial [Rhipicephalus appendiculatus]